MCYIRNIFIPPDRNAVFNWLSGRFSASTQFVFVEILHPESCFIAERYRQKNIQEYEAHEHIVWSSERGPWADRRLAPVKYYGKLKP